MPAESNPWPDADTPVGQALTTSLDSIGLRSPKPGRVLVMWSGGLDSVALLLTLLAATEHEVHAHHVVLDNFEGRAEAERGAVDAVITWAQDHLRSFASSQSGYRFDLGGPAGLGGGFDTSLVMFMAARVTRALRDWPVDVVATGHLSSQFRVMAEAEAIFHTNFQARHDRRPDWIRPLSRLPTGSTAHRKADILRSIPAAVVERTWWCRRPVRPHLVPVACGTCYACKAMNEARAIMALPPTPADRPANDL